MRESFISSYFNNLKIFLPLSPLSLYILQITVMFVDIDIYILGAI